MVEVPLYTALSVYTAWKALQRNGKATYGFQASKKNQLF